MEELSEIAVPFIITEQSQIDLVSVEACLQVLGQISATQNPDLVSRMASDSILLNLVDQFLLNGSNIHKQLSFWLISNFVENSTLDALKIVRNNNLIRHMAEGISNTKDPKIAYEACLMLMMLLGVLEKSDLTEA